MPLERMNKFTSGPSHCSNCLEVYHTTLGLIPNGEKYSYDQYYNMQH